MAARYEQVARSLAKAIEDATYPVGARMPTEVELAESYGVSRATVRSALDTLERAGLVSRRRRVGTVVEAVRPTAGYARTVSNMNDLLQYSTETSREVLSRDEVVADGELAERLGCANGRLWSHVAMLRRSGLPPYDPLCHTDVYLDPEVAEAIGDQLLQPAGLISELVERTTGRLTDRVEQRIRACALPAELADLLAAPAGSPCLEITRHYVEASGRVFQSTLSLHPADRFEFTLSMERRSG